MRFIRFGKILVQLIIVEWSLKRVRSLKRLRDYANPTYNDSEVLQSVMVFFALGIVGVFSILDSTLFS